MFLFAGLFFIAIQILRVRSIKEKLKVKLDLKFLNKSLILGIIFLLIVIFNLFNLI